MSVRTVSGLARQYLASFEGDDFVPKTLGQSGLLSDEGKALMGSIAAANLATEVAAMQGGFDLDKQSSYNDTLLSIQELENEQAKKKAIIDQLSTPMAGTSLTNFLAGGPGNRLKNSMDNLVVDSVLKNYIQTNRDRLVEKTIGIKKIVVPNMHPYDLIKMLAREAISDNDLGTFIFFENKEGLHFKSLKNLYNSTVIESFEGGSFRMTPLGNGHPAASDVEMEYKRALTYGISGQNDMLANIKSGMLGSSMTTYDSFRKSYYTHTYAHSFKGDDEQLESHSIYSPSLIDKENNQINEFPLSRIHLQSGDENQINTFQGTTVEDTITDGRKLPEPFLRRQAKFSE